MSNPQKMIKLYALTILSVFILSCELEVPVKEMVEARTAIEEAKKVNADRHSPDDIKKAETLLLQSHDYIANGQETDAKKAAEQSLAAAIEAEKKSLPGYASEQLKKSEEAYKEADMAYAEKFSPEKFNEAGKLKVEAKGLYDKGEHKQSAVLSVKAYELSIAAKNDAVQNSSVIETEIDKMNSKLTELKKDKYKSAAQSNLSDAETLINKAKQDVTDRDYKSSLQEIELARKELDEAEKLIRKQKISTDIQDLRAEMDQVKKKDESGAAKEDLDKALLELNAAESSLEQNQIRDAELRVAQAEQLIKGTDIKMKRKKALAAIEKAEKLLVQARGKDQNNKYKENLDKAEKVIGEGKSSVNADKFNEGISNAEEAETIISAVLNSMETASADIAVKSESEHAEDKEAVDEAGDESSDEATETGTKTEDKAVESEKKEEQGRHYVVQWRKKKTDCLWRIAEKVYKDAAYWPAIYLANRDQIKDPDLIFPGQKFVIPPKPQKRPSYKKIKEQIKAKSK